MAAVAQAEMVDTQWSGPNGLLQGIPVSTMKERKLPVQAEPTKWKPGQSGNPHGMRLRKTPLTDALKSEVDKELPGADGKTVAHALAKKLLAIAISNNPGRALEAMQIIFDRIEGKVLQRQEISGVDGAPMQFESVGNRQELEARLANLWLMAAERAADAKSEPTRTERDVTVQPVVIEAHAVQARTKPTTLDLDW
jgi:hypothetical protein